MRSFAVLALRVLAVLAAEPDIKAGGPQGIPTISGTTRIPNNTTFLPITTTTSSGNLSITHTPTTTTSQSVVLITTTPSGGGAPVTLTSFVGASPTAASTTSPVGTTQGAASKVGNGAFAALALAVGVGAFFL